ncbi:MAG TPA: hypothetical protein DCY13_08695 [Verrucomicrobiales bacterium]|nr:hypothetical protein [Verrucomicrobiales bacterium]
MKRAPLTYNPPKRSAEDALAFREIEREYHVRAFGEELARVNLDLTKEERIRYIQWMRENAQKRGVKTERPPPYGFKDDDGNE